MGQEFTLQQSPKRIYTGKNITTFYQGVWTPRANADDTTYFSETYGRYARIGPLVFIDGVLAINSIGSGNTTNIVGLPFNVLPPPDEVASGSVVVIGQNFSCATNIVSIHGGLANTTIFLRSRTVASASVATNDILGDGTIISFQGWYFTDE